MLSRVREFWRDHQGLFPDDSPGGQALAAVAKSVSDVKDSLVSKASSVDDARWRQRLRAALTRCLLSVVRTARQVARVERRIEQTFVMPKPRTDTALIEAARLFQREAEPMADRFVGLGMPSTFLIDLRERTDRFEQAVRNRSDARTKAAAATAAFDAAMRRGLDAVMAFDVIVANTYPDDPVLLAVWKGSRRIDRARKKRAKK
jgi:hypothetical protein